MDLVTPEFLFGKRTAGIDDGEFPYPVTRADQTVGELVHHDTDDAAMELLRDVL